jgi:hypothetical protein
MGLVLHLHDGPRTMLGTDTSIKRAGVIGLSKLNFGNYQGKNHHAWLKHKIP